MRRAMSVSPSRPRPGTIGMARAHEVARPAPRREHTRPEVAARTSSLFVEQAGPTSGG